MRISGVTSFLISLVALTSTAYSAELQLIGTTEIPPRLSVDKTVVGGLSAIDYDEKKGVYYIQSDDRSERSPSRFYTLKLNYSDKKVDKPEITTAIILKDENGKPFPLQALDPESFRLVPETNLFLSGSEGNVQAEKYSAPMIFRGDMKTGQQEKIFELPPQLKTNGYSDNYGVRYNMVFEALALDYTAPSEKAWTMTEAALLQDGSAPLPQKETPLRFFELNIKDATFERQFVYNLDPIPSGLAGNPNGYRGNGVPDILALDKDTFLVMERAYVQDVGYDIRLYTASLKGATDVSACISLINGCVYKPTQKKLLASFKGTLPNGEDLDNFEGVTWGKPLADGTKTLVFIADNNFSEKQRSVIAVFKYIP